MNNKDALDNIRRKAPAARKPAAPAEDILIPTHQFDMLNSQLVATQTQVTSLQDRNTELSMQNNTLVQEVVSLKGFVFNHEQILQYLVNAIMGDYDARRRRQSRTLFPGSSGDVTGHSTMATAADQLQPILEDEAPPSPLLHASKLLSETNVDLLMNNRNLEHTNGILTSPTPDLSNGRASTASAPPSAGSTGTLRFAELDGLVYPVGHSNGIDPMYGDHIHNIPYALPASKTPENPQIGVVPTTTARKQNLPDPGWLRSPQILLVEDDPMCRKIGQKFLSAFHCTITTAVRHPSLRLYTVF
jgi:osomolarity two-component system, response regulator SKN7